MASNFAFGGATGYRADLSQGGLDLTVAPRPLSLTLSEAGQPRPYALPVAALSGVLAGDVIGLDGRLAATPPPRCTRWAAGSDSPTAARRLS